MATTQLDGMLKTHGVAVDEFYTTAARVSDSRWNTPRAEGKWTPAQEVKHVILAYEAFTRDLRGLDSMRLVGTPFKRRLWRLIGLTMILRMKRLPKGAKAPRESRPAADPLDHQATLAELRARTEEFEVAFREAWRDSPGKHVTHPYFGRLSLPDAMNMCVVHTRHHGNVLRDANPSS